ncbi:MAG: hypothetical protein DRZ80_08425 [Thermoprotei archaeon]|nr:MAG: hypothetical protein DRZ80_08425 [Thermoprotei archaeon]
MLRNIMQNFVLYPKSPFLISPHLEKFCPKNLPVPCLYENKSCRRILRIGEVYIPYKVLIVSEGGKPELKVQVFCEDGNLAKRVVGKVKEIYRIDFDYSKFLLRTRKTPIYPIAKKYYGLRPARMVSVYEALVDSVIEQNINLNLAMKIKAVFVKRFGERRLIQKEEYYSFPSFEKVGKFRPADLKKEIRVTLAKANAIVEVAKLAESLPSINKIEKNPEEFIEFVTKIKGIGRWTAELSIAKVSKKFYVGPYGDLAVRRGFKRVFGISGEGEIREIMRGLEDYTGLIIYLMALEGHGGVFRDVRG